MYYTTDKRRTTMTKRFKVYSHPFGWQVWDEKDTSFIRVFHTADEAHAFAAEMNAK